MLEGNKRRIWRLEVRNRCSDDERKRGREAEQRGERKRKDVEGTQTQITRTDTHLGSPGAPCLRLLAKNSVKNQEASSDGEAWDDTSQHRTSHRTDAQCDPRAACNSLRRCMREKDVAQWALRTVAQVGSHLQ
eukprot:3593273-Rhodomonas_salina.1